MVTVNLGPHHTGSARASGTEQGPRTRVGLGSGFWDPPLLCSFLPKKHWPQLQQAATPARAHVHCVCADGPTYPRNLPGFGADSVESD